MAATRTRCEVMELRKDANQVLATIIWGNVINNVLLTLLSDSVLAGVAAFVFSAFAITLLGEIFPQAYFSRNALAMTSRFLPFLTFYRFLLYPLTKPTAMVLDWWLGAEGIPYMREQEIRQHDRPPCRRGRRDQQDRGDRRPEFPRPRRHLGLRRGRGDPRPEHFEPAAANHRCVLPKFDRVPDDPFLRQIDASGMRWVIVTDPSGEPVFVLDAHHLSARRAVHRARPRSPPPIGIVRS